MSLPVLPKKSFTFKSEHVPKGKIELLPFNVGQESILLQVKESTDRKEILLALKQLISECIQTKGVDVTKLPLFVIEEIFLRLRENSIGEIIELKYKCPVVEQEAITDEYGKILKPAVKCNGSMPLSMDLREMKLLKPKGHTNTVIIAEPIGMKFKYPSIDLYEKAEDEIADEKDLIIECIDVIFDGDNVHNAADSTKEELLAFWNQFTIKQKNEVFQAFFSAMPHLHYEKELVCDKCGHKHTLEVNSLQEIFT